MIRTILLLLLLVCEFTYSHSQIKNTQALGYDYVQARYLYFIKTYKDSLLVESYSHSYKDNSLIKSKQMSKELPQDVIKIEEFDEDFDLLKELKGKVYCVGTKFYFLRNDSTLVYKALRKAHKGFVDFWEIYETKEGQLWRIDLGNEKYIYSVSSIGRFYKKDGEIKGDFSDGSSQDFKIKHEIKPKDSVNMEANYLDFGKYKVKRIPCRPTKEEEGCSFTVSKDGITVLDSLYIKFYNSKKLFAIHNNEAAVYNIDMQLESKYQFRDRHLQWGDLYFLVGNDIKRESVNNYHWMYSQRTEGYCGNVSSYTLKFEADQITLYIDGKKSNSKSYTKNITSISTLPQDSVLFINRTNMMSWSDNGGFNNRVVLIKDGQEGLAEIVLKDSTLTFKQITAIEFDRIEEKNGLVIVHKMGKMDFLNYYQGNNNMRFISIDYNQPKYYQSNYLRYKKLDGVEGWINSKLILFDDL